MNLDDVKPRSVAFSYIHNYTVAESFHFSSLRLHIFDERRRKLLEGCARGVGPHHAKNRESVFSAWKANRPSEWMLCVDTNSEFNPDCLYLLLAVADPVSAPIVVPIFVSRPGLAPDGEDPPLVPMWYELNDNEEYCTASMIEGGPNTHLQRIANAGMAMVLIHRSILDKFPQPERGRGRWFGHDVWAVNGEPTELSEDMTFYHRCRLAGIPVHGYRGVEVTHWKMRREKFSDLTWSQGSPALELPHNGIIVAR